MTDYSELVKALRCENTGDDECGSSDCPYWSGLGCMDGQLMEDAAAAIEALLKENKELIEDHPEMVEADGHWEWRKPNGEVLLPKLGDIVRCMDCKWNLSCGYISTRSFAEWKDWFCADGERKVQE